MEGTHSDEPDSAARAPGAEPDDETGAGEDVPRGSRLWQLLATRTPTALHPQRGQEPT